MKKIFALFLSFALCVCIIGCGSSHQLSSAGASTSVVAEVVVTPSSTATVTPTPTAAISPSVQPDFVNETVPPSLAPTPIATPQPEMTPPPEVEIKEAEPQTETVYWVPKGKVWHTTPNCSTLSRSKTILNGTIDESGKPRVCKKCD